MENAERTSREITLFSNVQSGFFKRIPTMRRAIDSHKTYLSSSVILLLLSPLARTKFLKHIIEHLFFCVNVQYIQKNMCKFYCVYFYTMIVIMQIDYTHVRYLSDKEAKMRNSKIIDGTNLDDLGNTIFK